MSYKGASTFGQIFVRKHVGEDCLRTAKTKVASFLFRTLNTEKWEKENIYASLFAAQISIFLGIMHYNRFKHTQKKKYLKEPKWSICAISINLQCYCYHCSQGCQILGAITTFIVCIHIFTFNQRFKYVLTPHEIFLEHLKTFSLFSKQFFFWKMIE